MSALRNRAALRVAIVGAGPSALYAAVDLLRRDAQAGVALFDRLPTIGGLVRSGVSPDHAARRSVIAHYERLLLASGRFQFHGNVEIGRDLTHEELRAHHDAVIYASGASGDRWLGIAGEDLPGSHAATEFVAWYNGHPDYALRSFSFDHERAVVVGNGNVALDVARMLLLGDACLARTDIADHALRALAHSRIREVVIVGRRGPGQAAFTVPELLELADQDSFDVVVAGVDHLPELPPEALGLRARLIDEYRRQPIRGRARRLVLRFLASPVEIVGDDRVRAVRLVENQLVTQHDGSVAAAASGRVVQIDAGLVLRAIGYRGRAFAGLPFDVAAGVMPNRDGRVCDAHGAPLVGTYVAGWLKRGPRGVIGTNKPCSQQTVACILEDAAAGVLPRTEKGPAELQALLAARRPERVDFAGWKAIDAHERKAGQACGRPRLKLVNTAEMLSVATRPTPPIAA